MVSPPAIVGIVSIRDAHNDHMSWWSVFELFRMEFTVDEKDEGLC